LSNNSGNQAAIFHGSGHNYTGAGYYLTHFHCQTLNAHHYLKAVICTSHGRLSASEKKEKNASNDKMKSLFLKHN